ncbi:PD-(D/E)XK nuclease-like domain-containing protein [Nocardia terpenica]|uniref:Putative exodeoxyribonuclease 8 PDDEXK-like domain-containing protein n=1 Tax=Nocardia terpenica TaxID=455432 RepID=A0A164JW40_9NOCA|nr:PD-(D/E)XK nuclease-like domain-containing protein [Nocardia terpenica]KZM70779.1 hypothetical protein AWN90_40190 [Nocardia terpenica]NQE89955.1 recE [Nocardia terpenica]
MPEWVYHGGDPRTSLSSSGARDLLEVVPSQWIYDREHPNREPSEALEFGTAVHTLALSVGAAVVEVTAGDWRTKDAQRQRAEARAAGQVPLLTRQYRAARTMADNLRLHPRLARALERGTPEMSGYWLDGETGVLRRFRTDCLYTAPSGAVLGIDVKTADTADPAKFLKSVLAFGYDMQNDWYADGLDHLLGAWPAFVFAVVAKKPPHLVSVVELTPEWLDRGRRRNRAALDLFARCRAADHWPGYGADIHQLDMPAWLHKQEEYAR